MIVVSDTSCISNLITIGHDHLLQKLFADVIIPPAVEAELRRFHTSIPPFIKIITPRHAQAVASLTEEIDLGEAEAICLARDLSAQRLLIDEKRGRAVAQRHGLLVIGVLGVLLLAKEKRMVPSIHHLVSRLEQEAGFRLAHAVREAALKTAGEL
jgi:predicted nucleic acid-binding protein